MRPKSLNGKDDITNGLSTAMRLREGFCINQKCVIFLNECESSSEVTRNSRDWKYVARIFSIFKPFQSLTWIRNIKKYTNMKMKGYKN